MRKIILLLVALFATGTMLVAQGGPRGGGRGNMNAKERAERMTERMVKDYSLNDTQKQQVYEANLVMITDMQPSQRRGNRREGAEVEGRREEQGVERQKSLDKYDAKIKSIFTKEQYDTYTKKQAERQQRMNERRSKN